MRNIRKPVVRILLNTLDYTVAGMYNDYNSGKKVLTFRKLGIQISGTVVSGTKASPADPAGTAGLGTGLFVAKSTTDSGEKAMYLLDIAPPEPADLTNWEYGVTIREKVKLPGVHSNRTNVMQKTYGNVIARVSATTGLIDDTYKLIAETDIIKQIAADTGLHIAETRYPMKMTGSAVEARRAYLCTITGAANEIDFFNEAGTQIGASVITGATGKLAAEAINAAASVQDAVIAWAVSSTTFMVMSKANGGIFTVTDGGGTGTLGVTKRYIAFISKSKEIQFDLLTERSMGPTISKMSLYTLTGRAGGTTTITSDGLTTAAITDSATQATYTTSINSALSTASITDLLASGGNGVSYVYAASTAENTSFAFSAASLTTLDDAWSSYPTYPQMTSEDIFRIFFNNKDAGSLAAMQYADQPIQGEHYNCYYIRNENLKITSLHGAGYNQTGEVEYEIYVRKSICLTNYWDADAGAAGYAFMTVPATADTNWEGVLGILTGLAVASW